MSAAAHTEDFVAHSARKTTGIVHALAVAALAIAGVVLTGWMAGLPQLSTLGQRWTPMVVSTSLVIALAAAGALMAIKISHPLAWRVIAAIGVAIAITGIVVFANFVALWTTGTPLYSSGPAWRMAPLTAIVAMALGSGIVSFGLRHATGRLAETLFVLALVLSVVMLVAFLYGAATLTDLMGRVSMSPITGACLVLVTIALLAALRDSWLISIIASEGPGGLIVRRLLPIGLIIPVVLGFIRLKLEIHGVIGIAYGVATTTIAAILLVCTASFWGAAHANRRDAERRIEIEHRDFLIRAGEILDEGFDLRATLSAVANLCVPRLADWCSLTLRHDDGGGQEMRLETVAVVHQDPRKVEWALEYQKRFPPDPNGATGVGAVIRARTPEFYPDIPDDLLARAISDPEQLKIVRSLGMRSAISVPLMLRGEALGVLSLVAAESRRRYTQTDLKFAQIVAARCATAIDRARLFTRIQAELAARQEAETALRALTAELEQRVERRTAELAIANRELESFSYSVSHDLRTPLRALDGFSQSLLEDYADQLDETGKDYLDRIRRASQRMGNLIDALLELSRVSRGELRRETVNLSTMAEDILASLRDRDPERTVRVEIARDMTVMGDARLLQALLDNLLSNAWKFTGGRPDAAIQFTNRVDGGSPNGTFMVRDNGAGFDMTYASKLFGAFQRLHTDNEFPGTGVGLATAQRIVHRHGGRIWVNATPGEGAAFYFTLT